MTQDELLDAIFRLRYGHLTHCLSCGVRTTYHKIKHAGRKMYSSSRCGHQISPLAGTIFHKSKTPLNKWLKAIELVAGGASAKELGRSLAVTYKTAWRMKNQIKKEGALIEQLAVFIEVTSKQEPRE